MRIATLLRTIALSLALIGFTASWAAPNDGATSQPLDEKVTNPVLEIKVDPEYPPEARLGMHEGDGLLLDGQQKIHQYRQTRGVDEALLIEGRTMVSPGICDSASLSGSFMLSRQQCACYCENWRLTITFVWLQPALLFVRV